VEEPRDLATALRNPAVLGAADAVLRGETARVVDFTITVPVERQLRARVARIERPSLDGAVAVLSLHDITQLKRAEQMRADFIANASHELRTPLATLIGFIETLRGPARDDAEVRERFLAIMHGQASRMTRLVEDLLSLSRIELNEHVMPTNWLPLGPLLRSVAEALELRAGERGMRILLALPPALPDVLGDRDELAQVFQNLIDNALKYGRPGTEITVGAETVLRRRFITQVPVPHIAAFITGAREDVGQHHFVFERRRRRGLALRRILNGLRREEILDAVLPRHATGEQRGQAGRVRGRAYQMILEARSGLRQLIDVGRQDLAIAGAAKHP